MSPLAGKVLFTKTSTRPAADGIVPDFLQHFRDGLYEQVRVHDVRGMVFGVPCFPLWENFAVIGNMALAAVPVIITIVHFATAVFGRKASRDRGWISPSPAKRLTDAFSKIRCMVSKIAGLIIGSCTFSGMCHWSGLHSGYVYPEMLCSS